MLTFFFHHDTDFPEVLDFTHATSKRYGRVARGGWAGGWGLGHGERN